jgi:uncharacterized membrane protein YgcG
MNVILICYRHSQIFALCVTIFKDLLAVMRHDNLSLNSVLFCLYLYRKLKIGISLLLLFITGLCYICDRSSDVTACGTSGNHRKSNSLDAGTGGDGGGGRKTNKPLVPPVRER